MKFSLREKFSAPEDARLWAQFIAMAPFVFQAAKCLRDFGILSALSKTPGLDFSALRERSKLSSYALSLLLDAGESTGIVEPREDGFFLTSAGENLAVDPLTQVNLNFTADVCYSGLESLGDSLKEGKPLGLKALGGNWPTIYEGLMELPPKALESWLAFDHFFSDDAFPRVLPIVCKDSPQRILDVGGNTGKFAIACALFSPEVRITMLDHPAQLATAAKNIGAHGLDGRIERVPMDLLDHSKPFPKGCDVIWMSQFLDCFGKEDILGLFRRAREAMSESSRFLIMEPFLDRQRFEAARFCLDMTSLYFAAMANGNSRMYRAAEFESLLNEAGLVVEEEFHQIRLSHSILKCRRA